MTSPSVRQIVLASRPQGTFRATDMSLSKGSLGIAQPGQVLIRPAWLSLDPLLRIRIDEAPLGGVLPTWPVGSVIVGPAVGQVVSSDVAEFPAGAWVEGRLPWQDLALVDPAGFRRLADDDLPPQTALGVLGLPGFTAYAGLEALGGMAPGGRLLVSGASGAVGGLVGQLAKARGLHVTGLVSGAERVAYLKELGFDEALDRTAPDLRAQLQRLAPFQAYFDNVGGALLTDVLPTMAPGATVLICGLMAQYDRPKAAASDFSFEDLLEALMGRQLTLKAYSARSYDHLFPEFLATCAPLVRGGRLRSPEIVVDGLERAPEAFAAVFANDGIGKRLVRLDPAAAPSPVRGLQRERAGTE